MKAERVLLVLLLAFSGYLISSVSSNLCRDNCDVDFKTLGCFADKEVPNRALPHYIYNERDPSIGNYGGRMVDWFNWNEYFPGFACRCAQKARYLGYDLIGLQFYGECWAGHSGQHDYQVHGPDEEGCIQDDYQKCEPGTRYCMGKHYSNFVYQIVDTTCSDVSFERVGCFRDRHNILSRPLPDYLFNDRDNTIDNFSGTWIDWRNWDLYVPYFACRCAREAQRLGHTHFGMQYYGECWSGAEGALTYDRNGVSRMGCIDQCSEPCKPHSEYCSGKGFANFVYRISNPTCEVDITPVGCYAEDPYDLAMKDVFYNEADPAQPNFGGHMIAWNGRYDVDFPTLLCKCALVARENGWEYFGIREMGLCVRGRPNIASYDKHGVSDQCFEGGSSRPCANGSLLCGGLHTNANFVYKVPVRINGGYSDWGNWSDCSEACGGGTRSRSRECNNPTPQNDGFDCLGLGAAQETEACNEEACQSSTLSPPITQAQTTQAPVTVITLADDNAPIPDERRSPKMLRGRRNHP